jgi:hypothetical protein
MYYKTRENLILISEGQNMKSKCKINFVAKFRGISHTNIIKKHKKLPM